jgi:hypothetical protein
MNRALYYRSIDDLGRYYTSVDSLIVSLFKVDRDELENKRKQVMVDIDKGGVFKKKATDELYEMCIDRLETKYLSKQLHRLGIRREHDEPQVF